MKLKVLIFVVGCIIFLSYILLSSHSVATYKAWEPKVQYSFSILGDAMETYYKLHGRYPEIGSVCGGVDALQPSLASSYLEKEAFLFLGRASQARSLKEQLLGRPIYSFGASVSTDGSQFVLSASRLPLKSMAGLNGNVLGCNCNTPNYCIGTVGRITSKTVEDAGISNNETSSSTQQKHERIIFASPNKVLLVDPRHVKKGDKFGAFTVSKVYYQEQSKNMPGGIEISFDGTTTITGIIYHAEMLGPGITLTGNDPLPTVIPSFPEYTTPQNKSFGMDELVGNVPSEAVMYGGREAPTYKITAVIKNYTFRLLPKETTSKATLVKVIKIEKLD